MPNKDPDNYSWIAIMCFALITVAGIVASEAKSVIDGNKVSFKMFSCKAVISCFAAWLTMHLCLELSISHNWTSIFCGAAGWQGSDIVQRITDKVKDKIGVAGND